VPAEDFPLLLHQQCPQLAALSVSQIDALRRHFQLLLRWNRRLNLTGIARPAEIVQRHYCESLFLAARLPQGNWRLVDVGSGAGFPGVPVAVARPECSVALLESNCKKCAFLRAATRHIANIEVVEGRAEAYPGPVEWALARAVRWSDVVKFARRWGAHVALLVGAKEADQLLRLPEWRWRVELIPGRRASYLVIGFHVERLEGLAAT